MHEFWTSIPADGWARFTFDAVWQSTLLGLIAWLVMRLFVKRAALRAWFVLVVMSLSVAMPVFSAAVRWAGVGLLADSAPETKKPSTTEMPAGPSSIPYFVLNDKEHSTPIPREFGQSGVPNVPQPEATIADSPMPTNPSSILQRIGSLLSLSGILAVAWAVASVVVGIRLVLSSFELGRLLRATRPCEDQQILAICRQAAARLGLKRLPRVEISRQINLPALAGLRKARLLIPEKMLAQPSPDWLTVFCHELAHLRRGDTGGRLLVELARAMLPWQPFVWILGRQYHQACEEAADDWVVWTGTDPLDLATTLTNWASATSPRLATAMSGMSEPKSRIVRLIALTKAANPRLRPSQLWGGTTLVVVLTCLLALLQTPQRPLAAGESPPATTAQTSSEPSAKAANQAAANTKARPDDTPTQQASGLDSLGDPLPDDCLMRLGTIRLRHRSSLKCITFSPDGTTIASAGTNQDMGVSLWDAKTGRLIHHFKDPALEWGWTEAVAFSPNGEQLAAGQTDGSVLVWEVKTARLLSKAKRHQKAVQAVTFAPEGKRLASGGQDGRVCVGPVDQAAEWKVLDSGERPTPGTYGVRGFPGIRGLAFSPDGSLLAAGIGNQRAICIWDLDKGQLARRIEKVHGQFEDGRDEGQFLHGMAFLPDGKQLVSGGCALLSQEQFGRPIPGKKVQVPEIRFWDVATGKQVRELKPETPEAGFGTIAISADGRVVASGIQGAVRLWDVATGKSLGTIASSGNSGITNAMAISPDGRIVAGLVQNRIGLWDVARRELIPQDLPGHGGEARFLTCSHDSAILASGGVDGRVIVWDANSGRPLYEKSFGPNSYLEALAMSANGDVVAATARVSSLGEGRMSEKFILQCWQGKTGEPLGNLQEPLSLDYEWRRLAISPDAQLIAGATWQETIEVREIGSGRKRAELRPEKPHQGLLAMKFSVDSKTLYGVSYSPPTVNVWDIGSGKLQRTLAVHLGAETGSPPDPKASLSNAEFSADFKWLITREKRSIIVWDITIGKPLSMVQTPADDKGYHFGLSPDGRMLATADHLYAKSFGRDSTMIYVIDPEGSIRLWEPESDRAMQAMQSGDGRIVALALSPDHKRLFTAMDRGTVLVWDLDTAKVR